MRLAEGALGLCVVELSWTPEDPAQRRVFWAVLAREGQLLQGSFEAPGAPSSHALAVVERLLAEAGIALQGG